MSSRLHNPFRITKSNDLTDDQINDLWVPVSDFSDSIISGLTSSPTAIFILGGKGSGKSHLMRYYSFPVQIIRHAKQNVTLDEGLAADGYIGVYARCGGLDSSRFSGKSLPSDQWNSLFAYYFELWVADKTLDIVERLCIDNFMDDKSHREICAEISTLLDKEIHFSNIQEVRAFFSQIRRALDYSVNNAAFTNKVDAEILVTRGRLFYGLPKILVSKIPTFKGLQFLYLLDEFENFNEERQIYINTLVRERDGPVAFRIGSRLYGRKTMATLSGGEVNLRNSEYEELHLDERFRHSKSQYKEFAYRLISRRLDAPNSFATLQEMEDRIQSFFERPSLEWDSEYFHTKISERDAEPPHLSNLRIKLEVGRKGAGVAGVNSTEDVGKIVENIRLPTHPILEKLCALYLYQRWFRGENLVQASRQIGSAARRKLNGEKDAVFEEFVSKHKGDMVAQWLRENDKKQIYGGIEDFISMSEGLPRALITILRHVFDWSEYVGEKPFSAGQISIASQQRGVSDAADLFLEQMLPVGEAGVEVAKVVERLSSLFRINRFADKPIETSLIAFSVDMNQLSTDARALIDAAEKSSLLVRLEGGQRERNSKVVTAKFELNRMLSPRRDLPIVRKGTATWNKDFASIVLNPTKDDEFSQLERSWDAKMTAPNFGERKKRNLPDEHPDFFG